MADVEEYGSTSTTEHLPYSTERVLCEQRLQYLPSEVQSTNESANEQKHGNLASCVSFVGSNCPVSTSIHQRETFYEAEGCVASTPPAVQSRRQVSSIDSVPSFDHGIIRSLRFDEISQAKSLVSSPIPSKNASTIVDVTTPETTPNHQDDASSNHDSNADGQRSSLQTSKHFSKKPTRCCAEPGRSILKDFLVDSVLPTADEVGLLWKISELRVALQASERARHSGELEMEAMRKYLSKVEAAAAGLNHRIQQLENIVLCLSHEGKNVEEVQGKLVEESTKEARNQAAIATAAVEAAREATMELDKVRRYSSSIIKSQEEEIKRLSIETSHCHLLYQARGRRLQNLKDEFERLDLMNCHQSKIISAALRASNTRVLESQKVFYDAKLADNFNARQNDGGMEALDFRKNVDKAVGGELEVAAAENKDAFVYDDMLEHQVNKNPRKGVKALGGRYNELQEVQTVLGGEKAQLLSELALLRSRNKSLKGNLAEWQGKFKVLSQHIAGLEAKSGIENTT